MDVNINTTRLGSYTNCFMIYIMQRFYNSLSGHNVDSLGDIWVENDAAQVCYWLFNQTLIISALLLFLIHCYGPQACRPFLRERGHDAAVKLCQSIGHTAKSKNVALFPDDTQVCLYSLNCCSVRSMSIWLLLLLYQYQ